LLLKNKIEFNQKYLSDFLKTKYLIRLNSLAFGLLLMIKSRMSSMEWNNNPTKAKRKTL